MGPFIVRCLRIGLTPAETEIAYRPNDGSWAEYGEIASLEDAYEVVEGAEYANAVFEAVEGEDG